MSGQRDTVRIQTLRHIDALIYHIQSCESEEPMDISEAAAGINIPKDIPHAAPLHQDNTHTST